MIKRKIKNFSLREISISGQCFRMREIGSANDTFEIIAGDKRLLTAQKSDVISFDCTKDEFEKHWANYFDLQTDYEKIIGSIEKKDKYLQAAARSASGVRILRQDLFEMIITFIISQQNNIQRITKSIEKLCEAYGKKFGRGDDAYYAFPTAKKLASLSEDDLLLLGLGYRAKYIIKVANDIASGAFNLNPLKKMDYDDAKRELLSLYGVGEKVANCICLFALHHTEAFPIDTHIKQILDKNYPNGFPFKRYEGCAGILQQYMFYYDLHG